MATPLRVTVAGDETHDVLRRAAALIRERVEQDGSYIAEGIHKWQAEHIASWSPAVALAVADWLDAEADQAAANGEAWRIGAGDPANRWEERGLTVEANLKYHHRRALAVARQYLSGGEA